MWFTSSVPSLVCLSSRSLGSSDRKLKLPITILICLFLLVDFNPVWLCSATPTLNHACCARGRMGMNSFNFTRSQEGFRLSLQNTFAGLELRVDSPKLLWLGFEDVLHGLHRHSYLRPCVHNTVFLLTTFQISLCH